MVTCVYSCTVRNLFKHKFVECLYALINIFCVCIYGCVCESVGVCLCYTHIYTLIKKYLALRYIYFKVYYAIFLDIAPLNEWCLQESSDSHSYAVSSKKHHKKLNHRYQKLKILVRNSGSGYWTTMSKSNWFLWFFPSKYMIWATALKEQKKKTLNSFFCHFY